MDVYTKLVSGWLFPLHEKLKGHSTVAVRQSLEKSQWLAPEELEALQLNRLRGFLAAISSEVPYYKDLFRERHLRPDDTGSRDRGHDPFAGETSAAVHE